MGKKDEIRKTHGKKEEPLEDDPGDTRFDVFKTNPIFRRVPKNQRKVQIDARFKSMFHEDQFKLKYKVDKRGRPLNTTSNENLEKYYELEKGSDDEETEKRKSGQEKEKKKKDKSSSKEKVTKETEEDSEASDQQHEEVIEGNVTESEIKKRDKSLKMTKQVKKKLHDLKVDYARGELGFVSEESESDDSSSSEDETEDISHAWGELDKDAPRTEDATSRLALCNMDWDRVKAVDLMVLFHSFLPANGVLKFVKIYPSEYGKKRLAEEEIHGPEELRVNKEIKQEKVEKDSDESENSEPESEEEVNLEPVNEDDEEGGSYHMERLRKYQLNRLKYYYALLQFDSKETADKVYTECDGMEYESSATHIDLRFVPEEMEFDENDLKDECTKLADAEKYRPRFFTTTALQQAKVDLTWDETDPMRKELTQRVFDPKDAIDDEDLKAYLASSSSESEEENGNEEDGSGAENDTTSNPDPMAKYRALLESIESTEKKKKEKDVEMEITWGVGLKSKTEKMVKEKLKKEAQAKLTPWEAQLAKKKEKLKQKRQGKKKSEEVADGESDEDDEKPFSDDDVEVDFNDPFFKEELKNDKSLKKKSTKKKSTESNTEEKTADKAALELLMMDDEDHKHHFNLKDIIASETASKSKKKKFKKKMKKNVEKKVVNDDFEINVEDNRFSALFSSHLFNVDPSDPNYKNTKAMSTIVTEKQKRRLKSSTEEKVGTEANGNISQEQPGVKKSKISAELSLLGKYIQRNTTMQKVKSKGSF